MNLLFYQFFLSLQNAISHLFKDLLSLDAFAEEEVTSKEKRKKDLLPSDYSQTQLNRTDEG